MTHTTKSGLNWQLTQSIGFHSLEAPCPQIRVEVVNYTE